MMLAVIIPVALHIMSEEVYYTLFIKELRP